MKLSDAANILNITGDLSKAIVKKAYKIAAAKFHPDREGGNVETMKMVNEAYETLKDYEGNVEANNFEYPDMVAAAINAIIDLIGIEIEVCGNWVWVTGETKPHSKLLGRDGAGFKYAPKKQAWFYRPDDYKSASRGSMSLDDIRNNHGSKKVSAKKQKSIAA
jgi:hypothetical protein